jgi:uncharacterized membrane protein
VFKGLRVFIDRNIIYIALGLSLALAIFLRLKGLTFQSYWFDELFSIKTSNPANSLGFVYDSTMGDVHPPFYQSLLWFWFNIFGFSEYSGRVLSSIAGIFGVYTLYALGRELYNREVGIYASLIASTNYFLIHYSQEVRSNIFLFLFSALSYLYFIKLLKNRSILNLTLYLLFSLLVIYTHYFGFFLVASQLFVFLYYLIVDREGRKSLLIIAFKASILMLISLSPLIHRVIEHLGTKSYWMPSPSPLFFVDYMKAFVLSPFLHKIFLGLIVIVAIFSTIKREYRDSTIVLYIWTIMAFLLPYIKSVTGFSILIDRSMIIVIPALVILVAYGVYLLRVDYIKVAVIGAISLFALYHLYRIEYYTKVSKDQFREILQSVEQIDSSLPVYDFTMHNLHNGRYKSHFIDTYSLLIKSSLKVYPALVLKDRYRDSTTPSCFWALHGHKDFISNAHILKVEGMKRVYTIDKFQAQAFLYAYKTDPKICLKEKYE